MTLETEMLIHFHCLFLITLGKGIERHSLYHDLLDVRNERTPGHLTNICSFHLGGDLQ